MEVVPPDPDFDDAEPTRCSVAGFSSDEEAVSSESESDDDVSPPSPSPSPSRSLSRADRAAEAREDAGAAADMSCACRLRLCRSSVCSAAASIATGVQSGVIGEAGSGSGCVLGLRLRLR